MTGFTDLHWTSTDQLTLYSRDYSPKGSTARLPILCLHGLTRTSRDVEELAPWLAARGHRVLVPEMRGRGRSDHDPHPSNYVPTIYASDVIALLDRAGIEAAIFIGTSMGGIITTLVATMAPERVAGAVLNDVGPEVDPRGLERISSYVGVSADIRSWDEALAYVQRINAGAFPGFDHDDWMAFARRTFADEDGVPRFDYDPAIRRPITDGNAAAPDAAAAWKGFEMLAAGRPLLVLRGSRSDILSRETADRMRHCGESVAVVEISEVGHAPTLDEAQSRAALAAWLDRQG